MSPSEDEQARLRREFRNVVNMSAAELRRWLATPESHSVGWKGWDGRASESVGHASGREIIRILGLRERELQSGDYAHIRKVIGFVRRHRAQQPANIYTSRWRYSLMNWGHDPVKELDG